MGTMISFVVAIAAIAGAAWASWRFPLAGHPACVFARAVESWILAVCRAASRSSDALMAPRGRSSWWRTGLWMVATLVPMVLFFVAGPAISGALDPGYLLILGAAFPVIALVAAFVTVYEDYDAMDGIVTPTARRFGGARTVARPSIVVWLFLLFAAYVIAIAWWLTATHGVLLSIRQLHTGFPPLDYVLIGLRALPTGLLPAFLDHLTGDDTVVTFGASPAAQVYFFVVRVVGSGLFVGLVAVGVQQAWQLRRIVREIGKSDERRVQIVERLRLAPPFIVDGVLRAATIRGAAEAQRRLIVACQEVGLLALPEMFCRNLQAFGPELQVFGLERCSEMFRHRTKEFDSRRSTAILFAAAAALVGGKLEVEPLKKLLRLMTSVVILKKESLALPESVRDAIMAALKDELAKPRAKDDAALRGFLRDLQSALGGAPIVVKPMVPVSRESADWLKRLPLPPAGPAARPENPSPTVH